MFWWAVVNSELNVPFSFFALFLWSTMWHFRHSNNPSCLPARSAPVWQGRPGIIKTGDKRHQHSQSELSVQGPPRELVAARSAAICRRRRRRIVGECDTVSLCLVNALECCLLFEEQGVEEEDTEDWTLEAERRSTVTSSLR